MTYHRLILTTAAALALGAGVAAADCREELAQLTVAKEGAMAPLEGATGETPQVGGDQATGETSAEQGRAAVAGEGATEALTDPALATSGQDVAAQQEGGATAAEQAAGAPAGGDRDAAIARAQAALDAGDEAGCMAAVEEAKGM
jgi:hypothetical protein